MAIPSTSRTWRLPVLSRPATLPRPWRRPRLVSADADLATTPEVAALARLEGAFRDMYTNAVPDIATDQPLVIGVTSAIRGEGRTSTALGLALATARDLECRVLLAELDFEHPSLARELHLPEHPGLADALADHDLLRSALHRLPVGTLDVLPAGGTPRAHSRLLRSAALKHLLDTARSAYQLTVLDLPPTLSNSDVQPLSSLTDGILVAVRAGVTPARLVEQAVARFEPGKVRGVVLVGQESRIPRWLRLLV